MAVFRENPRRMILIGLVILVLICLVGVLIFRILTAGDEVAGGPTPPPATTEATTEPTATAPPAAADTPTPTRVLSDETPTVEAEETDEAETTTEPTPTTAKPTPTPTQKAVAATTPAASGGATVQQPVEVKNLLKNGDFEAGFDQRGAALEWEPFRNDGFQAIYTNETFPYIESGSNAQRVTIVGATEYNRYAGIYQQVEVVPGQVYTLTLHGQIRSAVGDVNQSSFGYRMQYAVSQTGLQNWVNVPEAEWVELPWDEQPINASVTKFYSYTTTIEPVTTKITLFVRGWNKWPDQSEGQYTFDSFSLVGPSTAAAPLQTSASGSGTGGTTITSTTTTTSTGDAMIDKGLPTTGAGDDHHLMQDGRFWGGLLVVLLLAAGAVYRARWGY